MSAALLASTAVLLDALLGEPHRWHPLVGFGRLAGWLESRLYGPAAARPAARRARGGRALAALVLPATAGAALLAALPGPIGAAASVALLYLTLGHRSLRQHAAAVAKALQRDDLPAARAQVGRLVSRDCAALDGPGIAGATSCSSGTANASSSSPTSSAVARWATGKVLAPGTIPTLSSTSAFAATS